MSISSAKATHGLIATFTATRQGVLWEEKIGSVPETVSLPGATHGYEIAATLGATGNMLELDLTSGSATVNGSGVASAGTLTLSGNAVADETVTIGSTVYTWKATVSTTAYQVKIGATASDSLDNLIAAINAGAGSGTVYGSATPAHPSGTAAAGAGDTLVFTASAVGLASNAIATTETMTAGSWGSATLTGGLDASTLTGGDGKDTEGNTLPTQAALDAIRVRCTAGGITLNIVGLGGGNLNSGEAVVYALPGGNSGAMADVVEVTATANTSAFSIEVLSNIAD